MMLHVLSFAVVLLGCVCAAPVDEAAADNAAAPQAVLENDDLKTDASTYIRRYDSNTWGAGYPNNYVTGYGLLDDKYNYNRGYNGGYSGYSGYSGNAGYGYKGYGGYDSGIGYGQNTIGTSGYGQTYGNGGYGGYGGNGGLNSYYGYNSPYYPGGQHLGYSYNKPGYGSIYNSGITPSLVTGYRGYSRR